MNLVSDSYKVNPRAKERTDTRNSWHEFMFVAKCRYTVFGKQKTIDACVEGFRSLEAFGFQFRQIGFAGNHVHFSVNVPKRYSVQDAEVMLKSRSSRLIFARVPNFRKRYPRGSFWSGYEHHQSIGRDREQVAEYIRSQPDHHGIDMTNVQKCVFDFTRTASGDTACS
jgi:putative transposase